MGLINSGGESHGASDLRSRRDGRGEQTRRRHGPYQRSQAFQRPMNEESIALLNAIQDVYLDSEVTIA